MVQILSKALEILPSVIDDTRNGIHSQYGFKAWFKSDKASSFVRQILWDIVTAHPLIGRIPAPDFPTPPRFACVTPYTIHLYPFLPMDPYLQCVIPGRPTAFYMGRSSYVFICPNFWNAEFMPPKSMCLSVVRNQFRGNDDSLANYAIYIVIHEMVHFYLGTTSLSQFTNPPETYLTNHAVALDMVASVRNPMNYQYYMAMVQQSCLGYPDPELPPFSLGQGNGTQTVAAAEALPTAAQSLITVNDGHMGIDVPLATS